MRAFLGEPPTDLDKELAQLRKKAASTLESLKAYDRRVIADHLELRRLLHDKAELARLLNEEVKLGEQLRGLIPDPAILIRVAALLEHRGLGSAEWAVHLRAKGYQAADARLEEMV